MKNTIKKFQGYAGCRIKELCSSGGQTIFILAFAALIAYAVFGKIWLLYLCAVFIVLPYLSPRTADKLQSYWLKFGAVLGKINTIILLGFVFYAVLTPLAFVYRIFNKGAVAHFKDDSRETLFEDIDKEFLKEDFKKLW
ncbi:MAG: SxtJ family membrane protein [Elusimicrobiota bacterium]|nr:SxtJ family membrane protein [Elusimicrobiota bacterium]